MTTKERNDAKQMRKGKNKTTFFLDIPDRAEDNLLKVKEILEDCEAKEELIKDALIAYVNRPDFDLEYYQGPGHRKSK